MRRKTAAMLLSALLLATLLTSCVKQEVDVKVKSVGTSTVSVKYGIDSDVYKLLLSEGYDDPFKGLKTKTERSDGTTWVCYTEKKRCLSFGSVEKALKNVKFFSGDNVDDLKSSALLSSVNLQRKPGLFKVSYILKFTVNGQEISESFSENINVKLKISMPGEYNPERSEGKMSGSDGMITVRPKTLTEDSDYKIVTERPNYLVIGGFIYSAMICIAAAILMPIYLKKETSSKGGDTGDKQL